MENKQIGFLYKSIEDTQATVRAIDVKAGFLFAVNLLPITALDKIIKVSQELYKFNSCSLLLIIIVFTIWLLALFTLFKTMVAISNPAENIDTGQDSPSNTFYMPLLFDFSFLDCLTTPSKQSNLSLETKIESLPESGDEIIKELVFEKMKVSYIRDIKIRRLSLCFKSTFTWIVLGSLCWTLSILVV